MGRFLGGIFCSCYIRGIVSRRSDPVNVGGTLASRGRGEGQRSAISCKGKDVRVNITTRRDSYIFLCQVELHTALQPFEIVVSIALSPWRTLHYIN